MPVLLQASTPTYFSVSLGGLYPKLFSYHGTAQSDTLTSLEFIGVPADVEMAIVNAAG
jgi:hypothetical protein